MHSGSFYSPTHPHTLTGRPLAFYPTGSRQYGLKSHQAFLARSVPLKRIGLVYNPHIAAGVELARQLAASITGRGDEARILSAWAPLAPEWDGLDVVVTLGGDGTIVRSARLAAPRGIPIVGINLGRLGFLAELRPEAALESLPLYVDGQCWVEERLMLQVAVDPDYLEGTPVATPGPWLALNEAAVGRGRRMRVVRLAVRAGGQPLAEYYADGVLVATPTGSTAYSLTAGGPVLHPEMGNLLVTPLLPHLTTFRSVVLPPDTPVEVEGHTDHELELSIDGQIDLPLRDGAQVRVTTASYRCRFLRAGSRQYFYQGLAQRLRLRGG
jgi:NAD+ kinase